MRYTCPKCNKRIEVSTEALIASEYKIVCPQCLTSLEIIGDYAYVPLEGESLIKTPEPDEPSAAISTPPDISGQTTVQPPAVPVPEPSGQSAPTDDADPLLQNVIAYLATCNAITPKMLCDAFQIDFARAAAILDQLERRGIIGPYRGGAPRTILIPHNTGLPNAYNYGKPYEPQPDPATDAKAKPTGANCFGCFWWLLAVMLFSYLIRGCMTG